MDAVKEYKKRRALRLKEKGYRYDNDEGQWVTTKSGHKIHISEEGTVDKGNQFVLAGMGKPEKSSIPKKSIELKERTPFKVSHETRDSLAKALSERKEKDCVFGGFYKVDEGKGSYRRDTFFNPYTGEYFSHLVDDKDDDRAYYDALNSELRDIKVNEEAQWLFNRSKGIVQEGDTIRVMKGRTLEHGTEAKVKKIYPMKDRYGRWVADYAYLDNGSKINIGNVGIVEDGKVIKSE